MNERHRKEGARETARKRRFKGRESCSAICKLVVFSKLLPLVTMSKFLKSLVLKVTENATNALTQGKEANANMLARAGANVIIDGSVGYVGDDKHFSFFCNFNVMFTLMRNICHVT